VKKKIFKVIHASQVVEKPKPIVILDRHRYLEKMMEEHKKMEEKKKIDELEQKAKKDLIAVKDKEKENKISEKKSQVININATDSSSIKIENQPATAVIALEIKQETMNENKGVKGLDFNKAKDNLISVNLKNEVELKSHSSNYININNYVINNCSINPNSDRKNNNIKQELLMKPLENLPTERKVKEKIELNNLLKNLNYVEEDIVNEQTEVNFEIPYYLTKEWVVKNLLA